MPVTPDLMIEAALLLGRGKAEVDRRNATSRAYYAAYHRCLEIGRRIGLSAEPNRGVHQQLIDTLAGSRNPRVRSLGYRLVECRRLRTEADYEIEGDFSHHDAQLSLSQCTRILEQAGALIQTGQV